VKNIIRQFDLPKKKKTSTDDDNLRVGDLDHATAKLLRLAGDIDLEEEIMADGDDGEDDNVDGWIDECEEMTEEELRELAESVGLVRLLLTKILLQIYKLLFYYLKGAQGLESRSRGRFSFSANFRWTN
jgi:hypothetical protein